jgi:hypothetical protein
MVYSAWHDLRENVPPDLILYADKARELPSICLAGTYYTSGSSCPGSCNRGVHKRSLFTMRVGTCRCKLKKNFSWRLRRHWHFHRSSSRPHGHEGLLLCSEPLLTGTELLINVVLGNWNIEYLASTFHFSPSLQTPIRCCQLDCGTVDGEEWAPHGHKDLTSRMLANTPHQFFWVWILSHQWGQPKLTSSCAVIF